MVLSALSIALIVVGAVVGSYLFMLCSTCIYVMFTQQPPY